MKIKDLVEFLQTLPQDEVMYFTNGVGRGSPINLSDIFYDTVIFGGMFDSPKSRNHWQVNADW